MNQSDPKGLISRLNEYALMSAAIYGHFATDCAEAAAQLTRSRTIRNDTLERCAHECEVWDSEPLSGRSLAAIIRKWKDE